MGSLTNRNPDENETAKPPLNAVGDLAYDDREPEVRDACPECGAATALTVPWTEAPCAECGYGS